MNIETVFQENSILRRLRSVLWTRDITNQLEAIEKRIAQYFLNKMWNPAPSSLIKRTMFCLPKKKYTNHQYCYLQATSSVSFPFFNPSPMLISIFDPNPGSSPTSDPHPNYTLIIFLILTLVQIVTLILILIVVLFPFIFLFLFLLFSHLFLTKFFI